MNDKLIVLDLDETILYSTTAKLAIPLDFNIGTLNSYLRPNCTEFIDYCFDSFKDVAVWTSSSEDYAAAVVEQIFGEKSSDLKFVWSRRRCTLRYHASTGQQIWIKKLSKISKHGYSIEKILMIDNTPEKLRSHYGNLIRVVDFEGNPDDHELRDLMDYLDIIGTVENVRAVEKRGWNSR